MKGSRIDPDGWPADGSRDAEIPNYDSEAYLVPENENEIARYLLEVNQSIRDGSFVVQTPQDGPTRQKNQDFMVRYGVYTKESQKQLLLSICSNEFCHIRHASDGRELYVFCIVRELYKAAVGMMKVAIYVKHDFDPDRRVQDVVVSLHELEYPIYLPFAD